MSLFEELTKDLIREGMSERRGGTCGVKPLAHKIHFTKQDSFAQYNDLLFVSEQRSGCEVYMHVVWSFPLPFLCSTVPGGFPSEPLGTLPM